MKDKKLLRTLKAQKTKLLNAKCESLAEFEEIQNKLNEIDLKIIEAEGNLILLEGDD